MEQGRCLEHAAGRAGSGARSAPSLDLREIQQPRWVRSGLDALALTLDDTPAAGTTVRRKRAVFNNVLEYAVELGELPATPLGKVNWKPPKVAKEVDRRVVVNPRHRPGSC